MSIADKLDRLSDARDNIITSLGNKGVTATGHGFEDFPDDIDSISTGSTSGVTVVDTLDVHGGTIREITTPTSTTSYYQNKSRSYTPSTSSQSETISADTGYNALNQVSVSISAVQSGTAGTPTATKGSVSNHSVSITPSVTNTTGYITGSTISGTPVTVSASELVSGSETKTSNGTYDVTNLASLVVNVSGGSSKNVQYVMGSKSVHTNGYTSTGMSITVAKTGTYNVSWVGWRSSSSGTMGSNLYVNSTAGTNQQTFTNTYGQSITLTNQSYTSGTVLTLYATAGSTSRYMWVANLIIEEQ